VDDRLRPLWNFDDLDASWARLQEKLDCEQTDEGRAEVLTQLARVHGLRDDFASGDQLIEQAAGIAGESRVAHARIDLERGRLRRSSGDKEAALPLFESAYAHALDAGQDFIAADAAHMAALAALERSGFVNWTKRGIELAEQRVSASYWLGPLLNNLGWEYYEAGEFESAVEAFERALRAREADPENAAAIEIAQYAVGKALRALDRPDEAIPVLEEAVASATQRGAADGWLHEELAEEYATVGRPDDARVHARLAIPLLKAQDPSFPEDAERRNRLDALADGSA
jgi:tetratricopeptide (TPR) repeat protein